MTGTGPELFTELGDRAQHIEVKDADGTSRLVASRALFLPNFVGPLTANDEKPNGEDRLEEISDICVVPLAQLEGKDSNVRCTEEQPF